MTRNSTPYQPQQLESQVQAYWEQQQTFKVSPDSAKTKFFCLSMLPYPSGQLHMGHVRNYTIGDVISRFQLMQGKNVMQPMGWDAFGLPAENAAIKHKVHPQQWTEQNIANMRQQFKRLGLAYDWSREFATCDPSYYRWEQWFFTRLFEKGLVYKKNALVNWDPVDQTVLANEQVVNGCGWRSGAPVEKREISQWFLKITDYADQLLDDLKQLDGWPEQVKLMQRNWIGRSEGYNIHFAIHGTDHQLTVFTTRLDTLLGCTYVTLSPEHPISQEVAQTKIDVAQYIQDCAKGGTAEETLATQEKTGIDSGLKAIHPITGHHIPVWIGNYVLMEYGTGAVMAVPAHDVRDYEFAQQYQLEIRPVIKGSAPHDYSQGALIEKGHLIDSGEYSGLDYTKACEAIGKTLIKKNAGEKKINYRLHDWGISRQRYWGTPIPIIHCSSCGAVPVPDDQLPVCLPNDIEFDAHGKILEKCHDFVNTSCPKCQQPAQRETDTLDTFVESSWYYARYCSASCDNAMFDQQVDYWLPVDQYIGGIEHAVMHLLYSRFFHKLMRDQGLVKHDEPFSRYLPQGMVLKDGAKMSKSKGNIVDPNALIEQYGSDTVRLFTMFAAPPEQSLEWNDSAVEGAYRFLKRLWDFTGSQPNTINALNTATFNDRQKQLWHKIHQTIIKVTDDVKRRYTFNTAIAAMMELMNALSRHNVQDDHDHALIHEGLSMMVLMLSPIVPHICHILWQQLGHQTTIEDTPWPTANPTALVQESLQWVVQVNGKLRGHISSAVDAPSKTVEELALADANIARFTQDKTIVKVIVVPKKLVNIVVK